MPGMIIGFMLIGVYIFSVLGIDISDFKIAGGILLFKVAFDMLQGKTSNTKLTQAERIEYGKECYRNSGEEEDNGHF